MNNEITSRADALARGLKFYFTGKPCKHGHVVVRNKWGACCACVWRIKTEWREKNREQHNAWTKRNPARHRANNEKYRRVNADRKKASALRYHHANKPKIRTYQRGLKKRLRAESPDFVFRHNLRSRIHKALRRGDWLKSGKTLDLIGCSVQQLRDHLESQFAAGMSWANYGHGPNKWNVDHIIACALFDLSDPAQQRACFHFKNLRPLWHVANVAKGAKPWRSGQVQLGSTAMESTPLKSTHQPVGIAST